MPEESICVEEIASFDGQLRIEVIKRSDVNYSIRRYEIKFDPEESLHYEARSLPNPDGIFADVGLAASEARRLVGA